MASDAFFPFRDGIDKAASSGIATIIQPGEIELETRKMVRLHDENNVAMVFAATRHFRDVKNAFAIGSVVESMLLHGNVHKIHLVSEVFVCPGNCRNCTLKAQSI